MEYMLSVAGKDVKITFMPPDMEHLDSPDDEDKADGDYNTTNHEIRIITKNKSEDDLKELLVHELIHAIFGISGLWQHLQSTDKNLEELICANLQSFLTPLIDIRSDKMVPIKTKKKRKKKQ